ncbi:Cupin domain-containing protein [Evansella caseinilytica]|uniref:Cupin domain-containing protein n=1 Tax=Evansella caseinilytica TaxID=1503961 RepID=A0A1H3RYM7_9BACI|nr:cupin domain-containing protein [Evansella caseinilytica]SDZ30846.1 Cupin domain-containing protein [Evansella caseinilytica]
MKQIANSSYQEFSDSKFKKLLLFKQGEMDAYRLNFLPGQGVPLHRHPGAEVYLIVIEGSGMVQADNEQAKVSAGDMVHVTGEELFAFTNTGDGKASLYVFLKKNKVAEETGG